MRIYTDELTMSHVGLGTLNEFALLISFGNAHSKALIHERDITPAEIVDNKGRQLYPAYFKTHLKVPANLLLNKHQLWEKLQVGIEVRRFGDTLLDSNYMLLQEGDSPDQPIENLQGKRVTMQANSLFVVDASVDHSTDRQIAVPAPDSLAALDKIKRPPEALKKARVVRLTGFAPVQKEDRFQPQEPFIYDLVPGRDTHANHAMIFAKFSEIMNVAEYEFLTKTLRPGLSHQLYDSLRLLERETYYYGNCFGGERLQIFIRGNIEPCDADYHGDNLRLISCATLTFVMEIYQEKDNSLLSIAKVKKLLVIPTQSQELKTDIDRYFFNQ